MKNVKNGKLKKDMDLNDWKSVAYMSLILFEKRRDCFLKRKNALSIPKDEQSEYVKLRNIN